MHDAIVGIGFRHAADLLRAPAAQETTAALSAALPQNETDDGFRILDGLWFPGRGTRWHRVDLASVRACRARWHAATDDPRARTAKGVVDTLETVLREDRMGLRRMVLWQLGRLLMDAGEGPTEAAAVALGVHGSEAGLLAAAVAAHFPPSGAARLAAETINEIWPGDRPHTAVRLAHDLDPADDPVLARLLAGLHTRLAEVDQLIADARQLDLADDRHAAAAAWLRAVRRAADDDRAMAGLLGAAAALADGPAAVRAEVGERTVQLHWSPARRHTTDVTYRILRFPEGMPERAVEVRAADAWTTARDENVPVGEPLHYAVVPLYQDRIAGVPRTTAPLLLAPDVADTRAEPVPEGLRLHWRADRAAVGIRVVRTARDRLSDEVDVAYEVDDAAAPPGGGSRTRARRLVTDGVVDRPLAPGTYDYRISCGYRGRDGRLVWSAGLRVTATAVDWPTPVTDLSVRAAGSGGALDIAWPAPERGEARVVPWHAPVTSGTDVSERVARLTAAPADTTPPPRTRARLATVSVLGDLAVAGSSVVVEHPGAVEGLTVQRVAADRAEVRFRWPEPMVLVRLTWEQDGSSREERRVPRSRFLADGMVTIPVDRAECRVTVTPVPRPDAVVVAAAPAAAVLPALPTPWWARTSWLTPTDALPARWSRWRRWFRLRRP